MTAIFAHPWGLAALAAVPAILVLHLFWQRFRPRRVAGLFLWASEARQALAGRTRERLYRTASLVLELLAATALAFAAAGLSPPPETAGRHLVVVLDGSASMSAVSSKGETFASRAAAEARAALSGLDAGDEATVIASGSSARIEAGPRAGRDQALRAVAEYARSNSAKSPSAETSGFDRALALARDLAGAGGQVLALTDAPVPGDVLPAGTEVVALGEPRANVALVAAERSVAPTGANLLEKCFVAVRNFSDSPVSCELVFLAPHVRSAAGSLVSGQNRKRLDLGPGATSPVVLDLGPAGAASGEEGAVLVRLLCPAETNALALDDEATLLPAWYPFVVCENKLTGAAREAVASALACVPGAVEKQGGAGADLVFRHEGDQGTPHAGDAWHAVFPVEPGDAKLLAGPYVCARRHFLLEDVSLDGVIWAASRTALAGAAGTPLVSCGDRVLMRDSLAEAGLVEIDLVHARSSLRRTPAWPVMVSNLVEKRRASLGILEKTNFAPGDLVRVRLRRTSADALLRTPSGTERLPGAGPERAFPTRHLGPCEVAAGGEARAFRVNFLAPAESDLRGLGSARTGSRDRLGSGRSDPAGRRPAYPAAVLAAIALAAAVGDWRVLARVSRAHAASGDSAGGSGSPPDRKTGRE